MGDSEFGGPIGEKTEAVDSVFPSCENAHIVALVPGNASVLLAVAQTVGLVRVDAARPQKSWRTAWHNLTRASELKGLRFHDLRHQCITELLEGGAHEAAVLSIAGHVSRKMMEHYSHIRMEAKRKALEVLAPVLAVESELSAVGPRVH